MLLVKMSEMKTNENQRLKIKNRYMELYVILSVLAGMAVGAMGVFIFVNSRAARAKEEFLRGDMARKSAEDEALRLKGEIERLNMLLKDYETVRTEKIRLEEQLKKEAELQRDLAVQKQIMEAEFRRLASTIMEDSSRNFVNANKNELDKVINPLKEKLSEFGTAVNKAYNDEAKERFSLKEQIEKLVMSSRQISDDTRKLTDALKGKAKVQGDWGEHVLETMLENSGLTKGREFDTQETLRDESGRALLSEDDRRLRPDVIVHYPDKTDIIIDAKTSLTAYMKYMEADDDVTRNAAINEHLMSVRNHVNELASKKYQDYVRSMDFVMMFIPNDSAYMLAMNAAPQLWMEAYNRRVMIVSPSHLISVLKMVSVLWRREEQNVNTQNIVRAAGEVYKKLSGFCESLEKVGTALDSARSNYDEAVKRLSTGKGNAIRRLEQIKQMGVDVKGNRIPKTFLEGNESEENMIE